MLEISKQKEELRKHFKSIRSKLGEEYIKEESEKINQNFIKNLLPIFLEKKPDAKFSLYFSTYNEVSTQTLSQHFIKNKIVFSYPKIIAKNQPLEFVKFESQEKSKISQNQFYQAISEIDGEKIIPDFIILPLLAFDKNKNRLGMGGGFFDRTILDFKQKNQKIATIGLAFDPQRYSGNLPHEKTDQSLDFIVSASYIFT